MDSGAMIYIPSFIKTSSRIQKLVRRGGEIYRQHGDHISLLFIFPKIGKLG
jgi:hypothetical protein